MTKVDDILSDEAGRLLALQRLDVLDTPREQTLDRITLLAKQSFNAAFAAITLLDADRAVLKSRQNVTQKVLPRSVSFCNYTIRKRVPLVIEDTLKDWRTCENEMVLGAPYVRSYVGVPLKTEEGYNIGSLCVFGLEPRRFGPRKVEYLEELGRLAVDFMEVRKLATVDHLTGTLNRRAFEVELQRELMRLDRSGGQAVLATLDLDHFKRVNDTYGHSCGDEVLRRVSECLREGLRETDTVGRIGGEEFAILLAGMSKEAGFITLERLRCNLADIKFDDHPELAVTASLGLTEIGPQMVARDAMAQSDAALYRAKSSGRNKTVS